MLLVGRMVAQAEALGCLQRELTEGGVAREAEAKAGVLLEVKVKVRRVRQLLLQQQQQQQLLTVVMTVAARSLSVRAKVASHRAR
jgi:MOSC domain-containing protein YiiM